MKSSGQTVARLIIEGNFMEALTELGMAFITGKKMPQMPDNWESAFTGMPTPEQMRNPYED